MIVGYPLTYKILGREEDAKDLDNLVLGNLNRVIEDAHPSVAGVLKYFNFAHLPEDRRAVSLIFTIAAIHTVDQLEGTENGPELTVALRKLLEGKDAAVRAAV